MIITCVCLFVGLLVWFGCLGGVVLLVVGFVVVFVVFIRVVLVSCLFVLVVLELIVVS